MDKNRKVEYNGRWCIISKNFLDKHNAWDNLAEIRALHLRKFVVYDLMDKTDNLTKLKRYDKRLTELEYQLQEAWGFERNPDFHRFWERPKCKCPVLDNKDRYPTGYYVIVSKCPLHGD